jgi:hypothetical protein
MSWKSENRRNNKIRNCFAACIYESLH